MHPKRRGVAQLLVMTLAAMAYSAASAAAQQRQARQPVLPQTPNDDLRLETELGFEYRLSPQWRLRLDSKLALDHDVSRARNLELRPGVEYAITPNWSVVGGYVQYQPYTTQIPALRGPFQDIAYGMDFGHLALANRVRMEELFFDELYFNLKTDGTGRSAGFDRNKFYGGLILDIGRGAKLSAGYQFTTVEPTAGLNEYHTIKLGFAFALN